jgi:hypothetical protein
MEETIGRARAELERLEQEVAAGRVEIGDYESRRTALLHGLGQSLMDLKVSHYASALGRAAAQGVLDVLLSMYLPSSAPGVTPDHTYSLSWTDPQVPGILQTQGASTATGRLYAVAQTDRNALVAAGFAQAALGILVKPRHALTRIRFTPEVNFNYGHAIPNPANRTLCFGSFGFDIPVMWAEQDKLA